MKTPRAEKTLRFVPDVAQKKAWLLLWAAFALLCYLIPLIVWILIRQTVVDPRTLVIFLRFGAVGLGVLFVSVMLWLFFYFNSLRYEITKTHVSITSGVIWRRVREIPFATITDVMSVQGPLERLFNIGHLKIQTAGHSGDTQAEGVLRGLPDFISKRQEIIGRVNQLEQLQQLHSEKGESISSMVHLLTGILNELREFRSAFSAKK